MLGGFLFKAGHLNKCAGSTRCFCVLNKWFMNALPEFLDSILFGLGLLCSFLAWPIRSIGNDLSHVSTVGPARLLKANRAFGLVVSPFWVPCLVMAPKGSPFLSGFEGATEIAICP